MLLVAAVSLATGLPVAVVRKQPKAYGTREQVEGAVAPGAVTTLLEDVSTTGHQVRAAAEVLAAAGADVRRIVLAIDRGGADHLRGAGYEVDAVAGVTADRLGQAATQRQIRSCHSTRLPRWRKLTIPSFTAFATAFDFTTRSGSGNSRSRTRSMRSPNTSCAAARIADLVLDRAGGQVEPTAGRQHVADRPQELRGELGAGGPARGHVLEPPGGLGDAVGDPRDVADQDGGAHVAHGVEQVTLAELADVLQAERLSVALRSLDGGPGQVDAVHLAGAEPGRDEGEDPAAAPDVDHGVVGSDLERVGQRAARGRGAEHARGRR